MLLNRREEIPFQAIAAMRAPKGRIEQVASVLRSRRVRSARTRASVTPHDRGSWIPALAPAALGRDDNGGCGEAARVGTRALQQQSVIDGV